MTDYGAVREDYDTDGFDPAALGDNPLAAIDDWLSAAFSAGVPQANAMSLATVSSEGRPSVRTVLLKGVDHGLVFYTNYESKKGSDIAQTGVAAVSVTWVEVHRQIRASGRVEFVSAEMSDRYFESRPHGAQIAAAASSQSEILADRDELIRRTEDLEGKYPDVVPRPPHWGGYRLIPDRIEFWQGRRSRMHDRYEFVRSDSGWDTNRLWP